VRAVGEELCPALGIAIPVGKDSLSMKTAWREGDADRKVVAPVSLIVSAFAPVADVRRTLTPELRADCGPTRLLLVDLGAGRNRLGGSCLAQVYGRVGREPPDCDDPKRLRAFLEALARLRGEGLVLAYHDRSDGGLLVTLVEMAFAGRCGVECEVYADHHAGVVAELFAEELGAVLQVRAADKGAVMDALRAAGLGAASQIIGKPNTKDVVEFWCDAKPVFSRPRAELQKAWTETSWRIARLRDNPDCADQEYERASDPGDRGLSMALAFDASEDVAAPFIATGARPRMAILREQGVNSQTEMAYAFHRAGFASVDVHMTDLIEGRAALADFNGFVACGGF
jgi:phosphoribosylformylglycinamidine synthase